MRWKNVENVNAELQNKSLVCIKEIKENYFKYILIPSHQQDQVSKGGREKLFVKSFNALCTVEIDTHNG